MSAEHLARTYYRNINAKDLEGVLALFSDNATFNLPDGRVVVGKDNLRDMYTHVFAQGGPQPRPVNIVATDTDAAVQVEVTLSDGTTLHMASFFAMDSADTFDAVSVYQRGR
ncbi:nuclear transport factor 2 family protein [Erythrobacter alti]|uniref:nuclear transport factor 2 family protein n=1 Tax=Erythrobacter alti TaxID=1896145 RepID=UPI0030F436C2